MGISAGVVYVDVVPNMAAFAAKLDAGVTAAATETEAAVAAGTTAGVSSGAAKASKSKGVLGSFKGMATLAAVAFGAAFIKQSIGEAQEAQKVARVFNFALQKIGQGDATRGIEDWASRFGLAIGRSDEEILTLAQRLSGPAKNAGGDFQKTLERMTKDTLDLAAATGKPEKMIQRLMNTIASSPKTAITQLLKLGIITQQQAKHFTKLEKAGKDSAVTMGLLAAVEERVGGAAQKATTPGQKLANTWKEFQESVGRVLLPLMNKLLTTFNKWITTLLNAPSWVKKVAVAVAGLAVAILALTKISKAIEAIKLLNKTLLANPYVLIAAAIITLAIIIIKNWDTIKRVTMAVWNAIKDFFVRWWKVILVVVAGPVGLIAVLIIKNWQKIKSTTMAIWNGLVGFFKRWWKVIFVVMTGGAGLMVLAVVRHWRGLLKLASAIWNPIKKIITAVARAIASYVTSRFESLKKTVQGIWNAMRAAASAAWSGIKAVIMPIVNLIKSSITSALKALQKVWRSIWSGIKSAASTFITPINALLSTLWNWLNKILGIAGHVFGVIGDIAGKIGSLGGKIGNFFGLAAGTNFAQPGLTVVGERGPEIVKFRGGEQVIPNHRIGAFLRELPQGSGSGDTYNVKVEGSTNPAESAMQMVRSLRRMKRLHARVLEVR